MFSSTALQWAVLDMRSAEADELQVPPKAASVLGRVEVYIMLLATSKTLVLRDLTILSLFPVKEEGILGCLNSPSTEVATLTIIQETLAWHPPPVDAVPTVCVPRGSTGAQSQGDREPRSDQAASGRPHVAQGGLEALYHG